ncbi:MAG: glycoside hydrolase family protein [Phycisphaeraceae bacterium]|nr:glycoside hydrolase family protein [Phycisphaeraceae bacterium]
MKAFMDRLGAAPVGGGFAMDNWWIWCGSVVRGPEGKYHMFASRWPRSIPAFLRAYGLRSEVVRAVSDTPEGPYQFAEVVLPARGEQYWDGRMTHNPTIHTWRGRYYLYYIGSTYEGPTPADDDPLSTDADELRSRLSWYNIRIGLAVADSPAGPWQRFDKPVLDVRPDGWDHVLVTNPAPCIDENGRTLLIYRSPTVCHAMLGAAAADRPEGPFTRLSLTPIFRHRPAERKFVEDPYVWRENGVYQMIAKDLTGNLTGEFHAGIHATSTDGMNWTLSQPPKAYSRNITWSDGRTQRLGSFERPQLLIQDGRPTHLFAAAMDGSGEFRDMTRSWNIVIPLKG